MTKLFLSTELFAVQLFLTDSSCTVIADVGKVRARVYCGFAQNHTWIFIGEILAL